MSKILHMLDPRHHSRPSSQALAFTTQAAVESHKQPSHPSGAVNIVELFQSQGCNSCPPTNDALLDIIPQRPDVLVLTYDVTYWDYIGWKDVFGDKAFDERQRAYANRWQSNRVYTPQVIVNGRREAEGSGRVNQLIDQGIRAKEAGGQQVSMRLERNEVVVAGPDGSRGEVLAVFYDPSVHNVAVTRGENRGATLRHQNVVRKVARLDAWVGGTQRYAIPDSGEGLRVAILVQHGAGGRVLAALSV